VKAVSWELQHRLVIADVDKRKLEKMVKKNGFKEKSAEVEGKQHKRFAKKVGKS